MSQTIVPTAPGGGAPAGGLDGSAAGPPARTLRATLASASAALEHALAGSPGRLRIVSMIAVLAAVITAVGGGAALRERSAGLSSASKASAHLVLLQAVQTKLVQADADATNSFLSFGLEPPSQQLDYIASIRAASQDLTLAAGASAADAQALGPANAALTRYTGYVASARANNLQGLAVGASYLTTARQLLTDKIVPQLNLRSKADQHTIISAYSRAHHASWWLALVALLGVGGLIWAQIYVARHSRRILNLPLAASTAGLLVALIVAVATMAIAQSKADSVHDGAMAQADALSRSRVAAFNAKSIESLTLIRRGTGTPADQAWADPMKKATSALPRADSAAAAALAGYAVQHRAIRALDNKGDWQGARIKAVAPTKSSANAQFTAYAQQTEKALTQQANATTSGLSTARRGLLPAGILVLIVGLLAAMGAWWGISLRLDEYR